MFSMNTTVLKLMPALLFSVVFVTACSGSGSDDGSGTNGGDTSGGSGTSTSALSMDGSNNGMDGMDGMDSVGNTNEESDNGAPNDSTRVLLFHETQDFRHDSTVTALVALEELAASAGMQTERAPESTDVFTSIYLANFDAVVWVMTSGDVLNETEQAAFENYIRQGGGYAGIHAASFTEYEWPWYGQLVGAYFDSHPDVQLATQNVEDRTHESTMHLSETWTRTDEWYDYRTNPRANVNVLLSLDESTYMGGVMGDDHPGAWYHEFNGGRAWYTGGGHTHESYGEADFRAHLLGGLVYVVGR